MAFYKHNTNEHRWALKILFTSIILFWPKLLLNAHGWAVPILAHIILPHLSFHCMTCNIKGSTRKKCFYNTSSIVVKVFQLNGWKILLKILFVRWNCIKYFSTVKWVSLPKCCGNRNNQNTTKHSSVHCSVHVSVPILQPASMPALQPPAAQEQLPRIN